MSHWWRAYDEAVDDPKLQCLSDVCFRFYFNLCCVCSAFDGNLPNEKHLAFKLKMQQRKVIRLLAELFDVGLIDKDDQGIRPHNWNGRQYKSDVSTERVKRFRNGQRNVSPAVSETPPDSDSDSDSDSERKKDSRAVAKATRPSDDDFERFWKGYPRRDGANPKTPARKKFLAAVKSGVPTETIVAAAWRYAAACQSKQQIGTPYVAQAVTWLNQQRWGDYPEAEPLSVRVHQPPSPDSPSDEELRRKWKVKNGNRGEISTPASEATGPADRQDNPEKLLRARPEDDQADVSGRIGSSGNPSRDGRIRSLGELLPGSPAMEALGARRAAAAENSGDDGSGTVAGVVRH